LKLVIAQQALCGERGKPVVQARGAQRARRNAAEQSVFDGDHCSQPGPVRRFREAGYLAAEIEPEDVLLARAGVCRDFEHAGAHGEIACEGIAGPERALADR